MGQNDTENKINNTILYTRKMADDTDDQENVVFVEMEDDVVLACLKIIAKFEKKLISKDDALKFLSEIKEIVLRQIEPINEDIDIMLESIQVSLIGVFASCECYINGDFAKTRSLSKLLKAALKAEKDKNMGVALDTVAKIGANILSGAKLKDNDFENIPEGIVAEWIDGVDCISAAMVGETSYKNDEPFNDD